MSSGDLQLPPGFRFHPTDDELVTHYLCRKCAGQPIAVPIVAEVDLYRHDPWSLPDMALYGEKEWYFFSPRDRKYPNGSRPNRAAGSGYWKATGADKPVGTPKPVAIKKALVFYSGKAPKGEKTNWIMHEYRLAGVDRSARKKNSIRLDDWVLCRIYNKKGGGFEKSLDRKASAAAKSTERTAPLPLQHVLKQEVPSTYQSILPPPQPQQQQQVLPDYVYFDTSESMPRFHADSSCSEHVLSSSVCEREVESQPARWSVAEWERGLPGMLGGTMEVGAASVLPQPLQFDPLFQDIFSYLQKPF